MAGSVVARAWVQILPEMDGIQSEISDELKGVDKQTSSAGKSSGSGFASAFKGAVGAIGGLIAAAGINELVQGAAEAQSQMSRLNASAQQNSVGAESMQATYSGLVGVLGDTDRAVETSGNLFALCGDNQKQLESLTTSLTGAFSQFGDGLPIESLAEAANETARTGVVVGGMADALNWVNASTEQWSAALGGNSAAQAAFNAQIDAGATKEDAFNAALAACSDEGERQQLVVDTLNALYGEAGAAYQDANADLIAYNQSQDAMSSGMTAIGSAIMPVVTGLQNLAATALSSVAPAIAGVVQQVSQAGLQLAQMFSGGDAKGAGGVMEGLVTSLMTGLTTAIQTAATQLPTILQTVVPVALQAVTSFVTSLVTQLPTVLMSLLGLVVSGITSFVSAIAVQLPTILPQLAQAAMQAVNDLVTQVLTQLPTYVGQMVDAAVQLFQGIVDAIPQVIPLVVDGIADLVDNVLTNLPTYLSQMMAAAVELFTGIVDAIPEVVPAVLEGIASLLQQVWDSITSFDLASAGAQLIQGFIDGIASMAGAVVEAAANVAKGAIDTVKGWLGIHSPSRVFAELGVYTLRGMAEGIESGAKYAVRAMGGAVSDMMAEAEGIDAMASLGSSAIVARGLSASSSLARGAALAAGIARRGDTIVNQTNNFNQPVTTPYQYACAVRRNATYGLAGARG